jgi:hypothetical protein
VARIYAWLWFAFVIALLRAALLIIFHFF